MEFADPLLMGRSLAIEIVTCMHIGLLCVQEDPADRPTMSFVVLALGSEPVALPLPKKNLHFLYGFIYLLKFFFFFFRKVNFRKVNYFLIFDSVMKNKLENTFQCLVMSWKISWKITY